MTTPHLFLRWCGDECSAVLEANARYVYLKDTSKGGGEYFKTYIVPLKLGHTTINRIHCQHALMLTILIQTILHVPCSNPGSCCCFCMLSELSSLHFIIMVHEYSCSAHPLPRLELSVTPEVPLSVQGRGAVAVAVMTGHWSVCTAFNHFAL